MCLAVPVKIVFIEGNEAEVEIGGLKHRISPWLTPEAKVGDYVLVHTGYAINVIDEAEAQKTLELLQEIVELDEITVENQRFSTEIKNRGEGIASPV